MMSDNSSFKTLVTSRTMLASSSITNRLSFRMVIVVPFGERNILQVGRIATRFCRSFRVSVHIARVPMEPYLINAPTVGPGTLKTLYTSSNDFDCAVTTACADLWSWGHIVVFAHFLKNIGEWIKQLLYCGDNASREYPPALHPT